MLITIKYAMCVSTILFFIGIMGLILNIKNVLITIMSIEIMLLAINLNFMFFSVYHDNITGQVFVMFILTIAASETAVGLTLLILLFKLKGNIELNSLKG